MYSFFYSSKKTRNIHTTNSPNDMGCSLLLAAVGAHRKEYRGDNIYNIKKKRCTTESEQLLCSPLVF